MSDSTNGVSEEKQKEWDAYWRKERIKSDRNFRVLDEDGNILFESNEEQNSKEE